MYTILLLITVKVVTVISSKTLIKWLVYPFQGASYFYIKVFGVCLYIFYPSKCHISINVSICSSIYPFLVSSTRQLFGVYNLRRLYYNQIPNCHLYDLVLLSSNFNIICEPKYTIAQTIKLQHLQFGVSK